MSKQTKRKQTKIQRETQHRRKQAVRACPSALFNSRTKEGKTRLRAVLDALDLVACEGGDGWIRLITWNRRCESVGLYRTEETANRQWSRMLHNMRAHGIDYVCFAYDVGEGGEGTGSAGIVWIDRENSPLERTAIRLTPEGEDRLRALVAALDAWLVARADAGELVDEESA